MTTRTRLLVAFFAAFLMTTWGVPAPPPESETADKSVRDLLSSLPGDLTLQDTLPAGYRVTSIFHNRGIGGDATSKVRLTAQLTRSVQDGNVHCRWNRVQVAAPADPSAPFGDATSLDYMEGFSYPISEKIMGEELYREIPNGDLKLLLKTLVWDAATLEPIFWDHFDEFRLNQDRVASGFEDAEMVMGNWGTLRMKALRMRWVGISEVNGELCALLQFRSLSNPVSHGNAMGLNGRSLYWGTICVSLEDKQVEYLTMIEDILLEIPNPGDSGKRITNLQREVTFDKISRPSAEPEGSDPEPTAQQGRAARPILPDANAR